MRQRIIFRYLFSELIVPFFLGLSVFVFILMMSQILKLNELIIVYGVDFWSVLKLIFYLMTAFLAISIPIAFLFSVLSLFGRLSQDSEIIALRASGFSLIQLSTPVIIFSFIVTVFCLFLTLHVEAWGASSYKKLVWTIGKNKATIGIKSGVFNDDFFGLVLYTDKVDPTEKTMQNVFLYDSRDHSNPVSVVAKTGALISSEDLPEVFLVLKEGIIHATGENQQSFQKIHFETYTINLSIDESLKVDIKEKPRRLPLAILKQRIEEEEKKGNTPNFRVYKTEYYRKFAVAFAGLVFGLLGISLGIKPTRSVKSGSFIYTILFVGAYWTLLMVGHTLAVKDWLSPMLGMWLGNILFFGLAIFLLYRTNRI